MTAPLFPALNLNFLSGPLHPLVSFSRASVATYFDAKGVMQTAASGAHRFHHDPATGRRLGLLTEAAVDNLIPDSENLAAASWVASSGPTVVTNNASAPDGTTTADTLTDANASGMSYVRNTVACAADTLTRVASVYIPKDAVTSRFPYIEISHPSGPGIGIMVNTQTGAFAIVPGGFGTMAGVANAGTHWRAWVAVTNASISSVRMLLAPAGGTILGTTDAAATGSCAFWGMQMEVGSVPSSYFKTSGTSATRAADACSVALSGVSGFNASEGTLFIVGLSAAAGATQTLASINDGSTANRLALYQSTATTCAPVATAASSGVYTPTAKTFRPSRTSRMALSWSSGGYDAAYNGDAFSHASGSLPTGFTTLNIGGDGAGATPWSGTVAQVLEFPRAMTAVQLQALTR